MRRALLAVLPFLAVGCGASGAGKTSDGGAADAAHACADLPTLYSQALDEARRCDPDGGRNECQIVVTLNVLCGCQTIVNDATAVHELEAQFTEQSCGTDPQFQTVGCMLGCLLERSRTCVPVDGGGVCQLPSP